MLRFMKIAVFLLLAGLAHEAKAGLIGHEIIANHYFPTLNNKLYSDVSANVGAGLEFPGTNFGDYWSADITDSRIIIYVLQWTGWTDNHQQNGPVFIDLTAPFATVAIDPATTLNAFNSTTVSIVDGKVVVDWSGQYVEVGDTLVLEIASSSDVPEPSSLTLIAAALIGVNLVRHRRRK